MFLNKLLPLENQPTKHYKPYSQNLLVFKTNKHVENMHGETEFLTEEIIEVNRL